MIAAVRRPERRDRFWGAFIGTCMLGVAGLVGLRVVRYQVFEPPPFLDAVVGALLNVAAFGFILPLVVVNAQLLLLAGILVLAWAVPSVVVRPLRPWQLRPWLLALLWVQCGLNHHLLDINPRLVWLLVFAIVVFESGRALPWLIRTPRAHVAVASAACGLLIWNLAQTWADVVGGLASGGILATMILAGNRWLGTHEQRLLLIAGNVGCQALAALLPLALDGAAGGSRIGPGMAYSFCESPDGKSLFAAVPAAPTMPQWLPGSAHGDAGYVAEYDARTLGESARHRFFDADFHGRLEYVHCFDDRVEVGLTNVTIDGRWDQDHAIAFAIDGSGEFNRDLLGGGSGHGIAFDARRNARFYVSENKPIIVRVAADGSRQYLRVRPSGKPGALVVGPTSVDAANDRLFIAGWLNDKLAYEIDLATFSIVRTFAHRNGGALGISVDADRRRLYTVGIWGMEVFDLDTGRLLVRHRLGLLSRSPAIDTRNNLVFVPSTVEGKMRAFDRDSLKLLGAFAIGHGARIPLYSSTWGRLYATTSRAHYHWDTSALAAGLRPSTP